MKIDAGLKRKDFREAADAGLLLWRENFYSFLPFFAITFWICAFIPRILLPGNWQYLSWIIIWWLKPLFSRIVLHIISIRFFDRSAGFKRLFFGLGKNLLRGLAGDLLWRRFNPLRSVMMPVRVLELNIKSRKRISERKKTLEKGGINYCFLLTIWGVAVEIALLTGMFFFFMVINQLMFNNTLFSESFWDIEIFIYAAWCFNYMLIETIYTCMGFSLYINSRLEIEGWDIEITFRNFAEKLKEKSKYAVLLVLMTICLFTPLKSFADNRDESLDSSLSNDIPFEVLQFILDSPELGGEEDSWGIRFRNLPQEEETNTEINPNHLGNLREILAYILRFFLIFVFLGLLIFLLIYLYKNKKNKTSEKKYHNFKTIHNIQIKDPKILLEKAKTFYEQENIRLAWGYCTAAAIQSWSYYRGITFPPNATESDCANIVISKTNVNPCPQTELFNRLIKHWIHIAYAGKIPPQGSFEEAVNLCISLRNENE
jgi:hypothetical protein